MDNKCSFDYSWVLAIALIVVLTALNTYQVIKNKKESFRLSCLMNKLYDNTLDVHLEVVTAPNLVCDICGNHTYQARRGMNNITHWVCTKCGIDMIVCDSSNCYSRPAMHKMFKFPDIPESVNGKFGIGGYSVGKNLKMRSDHRIDWSAQSNFTTAKWLYGKDERVKVK